MGVFLLYLLKSGWCLIVFYLFFKLFLSRATFFRFNRLTLLVGMLGCTLLPFVELKTVEETFFQIPIQNVHELLTDATINLGEPNTVTIHPVEITQPVVKSKVWILTAIGCTYILGGLITLCWLAFSTYRMYRLIRSADKHSYGKYVLTIVHQSISSFSWGRYIVLSEKEYLRQPNEIILHETIHLRCRHTLDLLFIQIFLVLHWLNPVVWLLRRELQEIHEFEADNGVLENGIDAKKYQLLLVKKSVGTRLYSMANGFNHSKLKKRITMMLKERTNRWARLKLLLAVPVMAGTLYAFAQPEVKQPLAEIAHETLHSESENNYPALKTFLKGKEEAYRIYIKDKTPHRWKSNSLVVEKGNKMKLNGNPIELNDLQNVIVRDFTHSWNQGREEFIQALFCFFYDGMNDSEKGKVLQVAKNAYLEIHKNLALKSSENTEEKLNQIFPILIHEKVAGNDSFIGHPMKEGHYKFAKRKSK